MKILNLYAGIGGNRKLWQGHEITAIEIKEDIAEVYKSYFPQDTLIITDAHKYLLDHYKEYDFIWSSYPCQTHSRARFWASGGKNERKITKKYPNLGLYEEIIFLKHYFKGLWTVENVNPFYEPLIKPSIQLGRHLFWSNFRIQKTEIKEADINRRNLKELEKLHGFNLSNFKFKSRKDQILRNCVHPGTGEHILNCAIGKLKSNPNQLTLF